MKYLLGLFMFCLSLKAMAMPTEISLEMEFLMNDQKISQPQVTVLNGQKGQLIQKISDKKIFIDTQPRIQEDGSILLNFEVGEMIQNEKKILSQPSVILLNGEQAKITQEYEDQKLEFFVTSNIL